MRSAVIGLGIEGRDLVNFLVKRGDEVVVFDRKTKEELDLSGIDASKVKFVLGANYLQDGFIGFDTVYRSAGIYPFSPELESARKAGVKISSAISLFFELCQGKIIGVTGTKGKGTTSTLIYNCLKESGMDVHLAGNIGKPYLELLEKLTPSSIVVLELSSFQLIDLTKSPHIGVVLNITTDHLDWHKDRNEYVDAKKNILAHQTGADFAVINADYEEPMGFSNLGAGHKYYFSKVKEVAGCFVRDGQIVLKIDENEELIGSTQELLLRGEHNWENITAAVCASALAGADIEKIKKAVFNFPGLEHRLELVGTKNGVSFYNDSFSTGPQPTIAAIKSFTEPVTLILGGSDKGLDYNEMAEEITKQGNVTCAILIGDLADSIEACFKKAHFAGEIINLGKTTMQEVVTTALKNTKEGGVVLLSPAAASFDMFKNYKERGWQFKEAVGAL